MNLFVLLLYKQIFGMTLLFHPIFFSFYDLLYENDEKTIGPARMVGLESFYNVVRILSIL